MSAFDDERPEDERERVLANSAVMAVGTVFSRASGFIRSALLVAAIGNVLHADLFNIANTIPNMLYILLAGGVVNAVLVPQLVRTMKQDPDGGEAYANRIITLAGLFLGLVTVLLVVAAPWVMSIFLDPAFGQACLHDQRQSIIDFARLCLPQVFFYGMYVLIGQVLNARGRFGPMMWAPIANNAISIVVLVVYLLVFGPARGVELFGAFTPAQELLLGLGATVGIAAQFLILVPYLRASGFHYRPRFDFVGTGLARTFQLGVWTVLFVIVNQIAYTVVVRLASGGTADIACTGSHGGDATGYTVYSMTFLIIMVPHSIITVSLATAILPRLAARAADGDLAAMSRSLSSTMRSALALVIPFAALLPVLATDSAHLLWGYGAGRDDYDLFAPPLALFGIGLVFFTVHYLVLRGFYALERNGQVFWIQCVVAVVNIAAAVALVRGLDDLDTASSLVLAYGAAYAVGATLSYAMLARRVGGLETATLLRFLLRLAIAVVLAVAAAGGSTYLLHELLDGGSWVAAAVTLAVAGLAGGLVLVGTARALRLTELTSIVDTLARRLPLPRRR
ncbi:MULTISPECIES: murein biosynthesis integral membrane protein MurJ [unclassified Nocardioides]|uniref:murein biosynthesis integral membrane protein MurJ n=1 Tax=unclassified Nocardioides TaxID=2615069 RepID=UPI000AF01DC3|nr:MULTISPECIES: murein biosynthesis integral membrane protein MurJ [unclassified Nocardioides]